MADCSPTVNEGTGDENFQYGKDQMDQKNYSTKLKKFIDTVVVTIRTSIFVT